MEQKANPKRCSGRRSTHARTDRAKRDLFEIDNVLVPLDFSRPSFKALEYALPLAESFGAKLHLVHAFVYDYSMECLRRQSAIMRVLTKLISLSLRHMAARDLHMSSLAARQNMSFDMLIAPYS